MMRRVGLLAAIAAAALVACTGDGGGDGLRSPAPELSGTATLPEIFPLPDGAEQDEARSTAGGGIIAKFTVDAAPESVQAFYNSELRANGWQIFAVEPTELLTVFRFAGNGWGGSVTVVGGSSTQLAIVLGPEPTIGG